MAQMTTRLGATPTREFTAADILAATPAIQAMQGPGSVRPGGKRSPFATMAGSASVMRQGKIAGPSSEERMQIAQPWQIEMYRHAEICGEARYSAALFSAVAGRAEIGISEAQALAKKAVWINSGEEVDALAELAPTVRDRTKMIRDYMLHWVIAGECYLIARERRPHDPGYERAPLNPNTGEPWPTWDEYTTYYNSNMDLFALDAEPVANPNVDNPIWEIVAVTELRKTGGIWSVRYENDNYLALTKDDPVIRMWNPNPKKRREAWSPFMAMETTLREIEWLTKHIFTQVRSRLMAAGVWFLPDNLTFAPPPLDAIGVGGTDEEKRQAIAEMNEAEQFMLSLSAASTGLLDGDEVAFPSVVMADPIALASIDQKKLIQFWSDLDDKAMTMRSDAIRRFALGMDLPPEQVLGSSGLAVTGAGGSAGSVNHWGVWANEEQTISAHIEPALDAFTGTLTVAFLRTVVPGTDKVIAYDTTSLRLRQDRSKEAMELYDRGLLKASVTLREVGFDPAADKMDDAEHRIWLLNRIVSGQFAPEQMSAVLALLTGVDVPVSGNSGSGSGLDGKAQPRNLDDHPYQGPPREQHDHTEAPFSVRAASAEGLVLRALEKAGNRLLNDGKRGRDKNRFAPAHLVHTTLGFYSPGEAVDFDFSTASVVFEGLSPSEVTNLTEQMSKFCTELYATRRPYDREALLSAVKGL